MNNFAVKELYSEKLVHMPSVNSLLKISLGLILFTMISTVLVYAETMSVDVDGTSYDVEYTATGMTVSGIEADTDFISLILTVDVTDSIGTLDVTFDRTFFDSTFDGLDDDFIILADGDEPNFTETETTLEYRTLSIELPSGTEDVEIIGSVFGQIEEETPVEETPEEETPVEETPKTQCGPGTILKDGACVLDERCGPGTILKDGACVLDSTPQQSSSSIKGMGKDMLMGLIVAFVGAGAVGIVFGLIARVNKSN
ncbi:MAG: hypothetical protein HKP34_00355 [Nitrosopumilus sp.]|nr:hypothetical protein [Nitrosopumilus sp.]NNL36740.1 hypothetical protein [Nitrosopumilus sp.]